MNSHYCYDCSTVMNFSLCSPILGFQTDGLTIITENDWNNFCEEWGGNKDKGISAIIEPDNVAQSNLAGSCEETITEEHLNPQDEVNKETETRQPIIRTCPEVMEA